MTEYGIIIMLSSVCIITAVAVIVKITHQRRLRWFGKQPPSKSEASISNERTVELEQEDSSSFEKLEGREIDFLGEDHSPETSNKCQQSALPSVNETISEGLDVFSGDSDNLLSNMGELAIEDEDFEEFPDKGKTVKPGERGGRPRVESRETKTEQTSRRSKGSLKAEIVCWKREREWILAVEIRDEHRDVSEISVLQNNAPLTIDEVEESCWCLNDVNGDIVVQSLAANNQEISRITISDANHLLFKLTGADLNQGRRVRHASLGAYLVIVSENFKKDDELIGTAPAVPEPVCLRGYRAYFFNLFNTQNSKIAFRSNTGCDFAIGSKKQIFHLAGQQIQGTSDNIGPLFGGPLPRLCVEDGTWADIGEIVTGEEGGGRGRWRKSFRPNPNFPKQDLPSDIVEKRAGWYFVRSYDLNDEHIDSLDFRFVKGLRGIAIQEVSPLPSGEGHRQSRIDFFYEQDYIVKLSEPCDRGLSIKSESEKTTAFIPAMPEFDRSRWLVGCINGPMVPVTILLERVWWALSDEQQSDCVFTDRCLSCTRKDLLATSNKMIVLRLPQPGWTEYLHVGFSEMNFKRYRTQVNDPTVLIPLRDFGDSPEMGTVGTYPLLLRFYRANAMYQIPLCTLSVRAGCKVCSEFSTLSENKLFSHIISLHLSMFFRELTYEEYREREPTLPLVIYHCLYCHYYVRTDDPSNPTSAILEHIMNDCREARHQNPIGPVKVSFRVVKDIDEIRAKVLGNLPHVQKCKLCAHEFENPDKEILNVHLRDKHKSNCVELR